MHKHFKLNILLLPFNSVIWLFANDPLRLCHVFSDFSFKENINLITCLLMSNFSKKKQSFTGLSSKSMEIQDAKLAKFCRHICQGTSTWPHLHVFRWIGTFWFPYNHEFAKGSYETLQISLSLPDKLMHGCVLCLSKNANSCLQLHYVPSSKKSTFKLQPFINGNHTCTKALKQRTLLLKAVLPAFVFHPLN